MTFKILSLDGGGIRGVLSATILKEVERILAEKKEGKKLHQYFDLIAGTSTGSILAAGIACQMPADDLIKVYEEKGKDIFLKDIREKRKWRWLSQLMGSHVLYPHERGEQQGLANVLKETLTHKELGNGKHPTIADINKPQLLLMAYDVLSRNTTWFANDDPTEWYYENKLELWEICTASASAPTFFPPYRLRFDSKKDLPHIDGGVSANNPELAAIAHALSMQTSDHQKIKIDDIAVLSIGTGKTTRPFTYDEIKNWGLLGWVTHISHIFLDPSAENSQYISQRILGSIGNQNRLRLNFDLNKRGQGKQDAQQISEEIDNPDTCKDLIKAAERYLDCEKIDYQGKTVSVRSAIQQFIESHD